MPVFSCVSPNALDNYATMPRGASYGPPASGDRVRRRRSAGVRKDQIGAPTGFKHYGHVSHGATGGDVRRERCRAYLIEQDEGVALVMAALHGTDFPTALGARPPRPAPAPVAKDEAMPLPPSPPKVVAKRKAAPNVTPSIIRAVGDGSDNKHLPTMARGGGRSAAPQFDGLLAPSAEEHPFLGAVPRESTGETLNLSPSMAALVRSAVDNDDLQAPLGRDAHGRPLERSAYDGQIVTTTMNARVDGAVQELAAALKAGA